MPTDQQMAALMMNQGLGMPGAPINIGQPATGMNPLMAAMAQGTNFINPSQYGSQGTGMPQSPDTPPPASLAPPNPADAMPAQAFPPSSADVVRHNTAEMHDINTAKEAAQRAAQQQAEVAALNQAKAQSQGMTQGMPTGPGGGYSTQLAPPGMHGPDGVDPATVRAQQQASDNNFLHPGNRRFIDDRGPLLTSLTDGTNLAPPRMNTIKRAGEKYSAEEMAALSPESKRAIEGRDKKLAETKSLEQKYADKGGDNNWVFKGDASRGVAVRKGEWDKGIEREREQHMARSVERAKSGNLKFAGDDRREIGAEAFDNLLAKHDERKAADRTAQQASVNQPFAGNLTRNDVDALVARHGPEGASHIIHSITAGTPHDLSPLLHQGQFNKEVELKELENADKALALAFAQAQQNNDKPTMDKISKQQALIAAKRAGGRVDVSPVPPPPAGPGMWAGLWNSITGGSGPPVVHSQPLVGPDGQPMAMAQ